MKTRYRLIKVYGFTILIAALLALAGCAPVPGAPATGGTPGAGQTPEAGEGTASPAGETTPEIPQTGGNRVEVQLEEFTIGMPTSINSGQTVFEVMNVGTEEHSFKIEGQGVEAELDHHLQPGESLTLTVDLPPGTYNVFCPVDDHAAEGMQLELTVNAP